MRQQGSNNWRYRILENFSLPAAKSSRLTVVSDPDGLLTDPGVVESIRANGFDLITFEDPVVFRFVYESRFRQHWDRCEATHLVVLVRGNQEKLNDIPYDILEEAHDHGRVLCFSLAELFPMLAPHIVSELSYSYFDVLSQATRTMLPHHLGFKGTCEFILHHVFDVKLEQIQTPIDLMRVLLRRHYRSQIFPEILDNHIIMELSKREDWHSWPLERIVPNRASFLHFLQERWPYFLFAQGYPVISGREPPQPWMPGPLELPFHHSDIRIYIDNFFTEGLLVPTTAIDADEVRDTWYRIGVVGSSVEDTDIRLERLLSSLERDLSVSEVGYEYWTQVASRWSEVVYLRWQSDENVDLELLHRMNQLHDLLEERFASWMLQGYSAIHSLPYLPKPVTLDKIGRYLSHHRKQSGGAKIALLVIDGLAMNQWLVLRETLTDLMCEESQIFAWVPTLTAVSRQSIFANEPPFFFTQSLDNTQKEPKHWLRFWDAQGLYQPAAVAYLCQRKQEQESDFIARISEVIETSVCQVIGIVLGIVDRMIHGTVTGTGGMHASVRHWARQGHLRMLLQKLLSNGFHVFLTSDHGNIEARGIGKPNVGDVAHERGERVHVFAHEQIRANVHKDYPDTLLWPNFGLPDDYKVLFPRGRKAFIREGNHTIGHGGISLEEVIVPFVRITESL